MPYWDYKSSGISLKFNTKKFIAYQRNQTMFNFRTKKMKIVHSPFQWKRHSIGPPVYHRGKL